MGLCVYIHFTKSRPKKMGKEGEGGGEGGLMRMCVVRGAVFRGWVANT